MEPGSPQLRAFLLEIIEIFSITILRNDSYYVIKDYKKNGKRSTKVVEKLGTHAELLKKCGDLDPVAWANTYIEELNRKENENELEYVAKYSSSKMLVKGKQRRFKGGCLFVKSLYSQLGLPKICQQIAKEYKITYNLSDILNMLVATRIFDPASK